MLPLSGVRLRADSDEWRTSRTLVSARSDSEGGRRAARRPRGARSFVKPLAAVVLLVAVGCQKAEPGSAGIRPSAFVPSAAAPSSRVAAPAPSSAASVASGAGTSDLRPCDEVFPTIGQRWRERLTVRTSLPGEGASEHLRASAELLEEDVNIEVLALERGTPTAIRREVRGPLPGPAKEIGTTAAAPGVERFIDGFSVGPAAWPAIVARARDDKSAGWASPVVRRALGAALARRLVSALGQASLDHVRLELAAGARKDLAWGDALVFHAQASGSTSSAAAGWGLSQEFQLSGELLLRAEDAALVSLSLAGPTTLIESWRSDDGRSRKNAAPINATLTLTFERPCFASSIKYP